MKIIPTPVILPYPALHVQDAAATSLPSMVTWSSWGSLLRPELCRTSAASVTSFAPRSFTLHTTTCFASKTASPSVSSREVSNCLSMNFSTLEKGRLTVDGQKKAHVPIVIFHGEVLTRSKRHVYIRPVSTENTFLRCQQGVANRTAVIVNQIRA